jgi:hypothetical protein
MMRKLFRPQVFVASLFLGLLMNACAPSSAVPPPTDIPTQPQDMPLPTDVHYTMAEVRQLAGFDVKEPAYLPPGVFFDYATYETSSTPLVILHFKLIHETYGDMGAFFQILQQPVTDTAPNMGACDSSDTNCETVQVGDLSLNYHLTTPTESLSWEQDGFTLLLLRTAGEPGKLYKDELIKVAGSLE